MKFEEIEKRHEILVYDISISPRYDYENTPLRDYIDKEKEDNQKFVEKLGSHHELEVDYHLFDFNDDGIEDYLLCIAGIGKDGRLLCDCPAWIESYPAVCSGDGWL